MIHSLITLNVATYFIPTVNVNVLFLTNLIRNFNAIPSITTVPLLLLLLDLLPPEKPAKLLRKQFPHATGMNS